MFTQMTFQLPETLPPGAYVIEVDSGAEGVLDRRLMVVSDAQLVVQTYNSSENLALFVDSDTGAPVGRSRFIYKRWRYEWDGNRYVWHIDVARYDSDPQGRTRIPAAGRSNWQGYLLFAEGEGRYAFVQEGFPWWQRSGWGRGFTGTRMLPITDRPVYRPGQEVHLKTILRNRDGGEWRNVSGGRYSVQIFNPKGEEKLNTTVTAGKFGAIEVDLELASDAALGSWYYYVRAGNGNWIGSGYFQVEEYKKPEFEVKVSPPDKPIKLGQAVSASIKGEYYFGGPAAGADVKYKVYRKFYWHSVYFPRPFDWLFNWRSPTWSGTPDQQFHRNSGSELVTEGEGKLNENGELIIEWNTQKAFEDWGEYDHLYEVTADVTDSSRRTISGSGSVKALRQAFFAFVDNKLGYYRPGDRADVEIRTVTADDKPVKATGKLEIHRVTFKETTGEDGNPKVEETKTLVRTVDLNTDERGIARFDEVLDMPGTFDLVYITRDEWDGEIKGQARILVKADSWVPGSYRFNRISLFPQRRVYKEGEVAKVLLASDFKDAWMLISVMGGSEVVSQTFTALTDFGGQLELELTIGREHLPNFHINVMTIYKGELHTQTVELFVPPVDQFLDVQITSDKEWYRPGEKGKVTVTAKDNKGRPVVGEFAVSIYDRSITYIMPDTTPNIQKHFYGDRRSYNLNYTNSYNTGVGTGHWDLQKYEKYKYYGAPLGWGVRDWI
ncbi:MAG: MG2 domain-containing protein, partial [Nitrospira sp.]|nr:MG2 domain-containing protein [Nitrospira sp.]